MASTIFERCGGFATVRKVVSAFYDRILDSRDLQKYFVEVDMRALIDHQTKFIAYVMGGPTSIPDDVLRRAHASLAISHADFEEMGRLLKETLEDFSLEPGDIAHIMQEVRRREPLVVTRHD